MATRDFEVRQLFKAYRKGLISEDLFAAQMKEVGEAQGRLDVANVLDHRGDGAKVAARRLRSLRRYRGRGKIGRPEMY
jgi:hypothetical protein